MKPKLILGAILLGAITSTSCNYKDKKDKTVKPTPIPEDDSSGGAYCYDPAYIKDIDSINTQKEEESEKVFQSLPQENMPKFKGDLLSYLSKKIKYPEQAKLAGIQGRVICQFIIEKDGSITDIKVLRGIDPILDEEALRVLEGMPNWEPGTQHDKPVRVRYIVPVTFKIEK